MALEPKKITKEHVLAAVRRIDASEVKLHPSTKFDVIINGKAYPPKEVMRYAHEEMNGEYDWFESGGNPTNRYLENMGFEIEQKDSSDMTNLFKSTIEKLKNAIENDSKIEFKRLTDAWAWFGDKQGMIGDPKTHYEVYFNKEENLISVDLHFEGPSKKPKRQFQPILDELSAPLTEIPWQGWKSIRYGEGISLTPGDLKSKVLGSDELVVELKHQLLDLEDKIGDKVRAILGKSNTEKPDNDNTMSIPLNQILFGPPGTGKTFNTINKAIAIINPEFDLNQPRNLIKDEYDRLVKAGQIVFTTFHQNMSYEDFIEGIKPKTENGSVIYKIQDGIFKEIANRASQTKQKYVSLDVDGKQVLTEELFKDFYDQFASTLNSADQNESNCTLKTTEGYQFDLFKNSAGSISIKSGQKRTKMSASLNELTQVFFHDKPPVYKSYENVIIQKILEDKNYQESDSDNSEKKFVLIIDEINRGNVSQIFGELITLIEKDKRLGKSESLQVDLTYSKNKFGVPHNLYIIGTMNTADRSVEALDAALRRRFSFIEMPPQPDLIASKGKLKEVDGILSGISLPVLLSTINQRIEKLLDRDHQIGHSYFMSVASLDDLKVAFQNKIIPLLQEYFFGDYGKIGLVLGKGFVRKKEWDKNLNSFADFDHESSSDFESRDMFELVDYTNEDLDYVIEIEKKPITMDFNKAIKLLMKQAIE